MSNFDVAIIGGGLIGASSAFELTARKLRVIVLDSQQPGREASWAAAGMLAPGPSGPDDIPLFPLAKESLQLYPEFIAAIEDASGKSAEFRRDGTLEVFFSPEAETARDSFVEQHQSFGIRARPISIDAAREIEPWLGPAVDAAAWLPEEATVDPRLLTQATLSAAQARGAQVRPNCAVSTLLHERGRCVGIIAGGEKIFARHVVVAAGCRSSSLGDEIARYAPTRPVRGQMLCLRPHPVSAQGRPAANMRRVLRSANGYLVPRADGRILAGSTLEDAGFDKFVTPGGIAKIIGVTLALAPSISSAEILDAWAGLRPGTPDNLPIIGPTDVEGLLIATGHHRNGILLAPITAKLVAALVAEEESRLDIGPFSPMRFAQRAVSATAPTVTG